MGSIRGAVVLASTVIRSESGSVIFPVTDRTLHLSG